MSKTLLLIKDLMEVWATLIPLVVYFIKRPRSRWTRPVIVYLSIAFIFYLAINIIWKRITLGLDDWFREELWWWWDTDSKGRKYFSNTIFYNLISMTRLLCFTWFFGVFYDRFRKLNRFVPWFFLVFVIVNYTLFENIKVFSSKQITVEAFILLSYCVIYFFKVLRDERIETKEERSAFWVITGLSFYMAVNFFIFLLYKQLTVSLKDFAVAIWPIHNIAYLIFCIFIAIGFWKNERAK